MTLMGLWLKFAAIQPERSESSAAVESRLAPTSQSSLIPPPLSYLLTQLLDHNTH